MGRFWMDDAEVYAWADLLGSRMAGLANKEMGAYGPGAVSAMGMALHENARDFLGLDPQKILDEWDRMQKAARDIGVDLSETVTVELGATRDHLLGWYGAGADAFRRQVDQMRAFTGTQCEYIAKAIMALGAMLRLAVQARADFGALADATIGQIDKVFADQTDGHTEFLLKVGNSLVKTVIGAVADPAKAIFAVAENVMDVALETVTLAIKGGKLGDIVKSYVQQRDRLLNGYENELAQVAELIRHEQDVVAATRVEMFDPLPVDLNVNSPDFRYENFMSKDNDAGRFGPMVEAERQKWVAEKQPRPANPDSPIQQRLAGGK